MSICHERFFFFSHQASAVVFFQVHGKCGSVRARLIPAPRGSGIVGSPVMKCLGDEGTSSRLDDVGWVGRTWVGKDLGDTSDTLIFWIDFEHQVVFPASFGPCHLN